MNEVDGLSVHPLYSSSTSPFSFLFWWRDWVLLLFYLFLLAKFLDLGFGIWIGAKNVKTIFFLRDVRKSGCEDGERTVQDMPC